MKISEAFRAAPLLIVYICAGDPTPAATPDLVRRLAAAGADIIELGLPHSDPIADGPTIQAAAQRAIAAGMNTDVYFQVAAQANVAIPKVFMGYYNMIYARGLDRFAEDCARSGITGMIVPDLPPEEAGPLQEACAQYDVDLIFLAAPNTPPERLKMIEEETSGFLYLVARTGVTGAQKRYPAGHARPHRSRAGEQAQSGRLWHLHSRPGGGGDRRRSRRAPLWARSAWT